MKVTENIIDIENLKYRRNGRNILYIKKWQLKKGEWWTVAGPNGCGKSTFLKVLMGSPYSYSDKTVFTYFGKSGPWHLIDLQKNFGYVSSRLESLIPGHDFVRDIVVSGFFASMGLYNVPTKAMRTAADKQMLFFSIGSLKNRTFETLSTGERRRTLLARALVHKPEVLFLDEALSSLDAPAKAEFLTHLSRLKKKISMVYVTHHPDEAPAETTHVLLLKNNRIYKGGRVSELMNVKSFSRCFSWIFSEELFSKWQK